MSERLINPFSLGVLLLSISILTPTKMNCKYKKDDTTLQFYVGKNLRQILTNPEYVRDKYIKGLRASVEENYTFQESAYCTAVYFVGIAPVLFITTFGIVPFPGIVALFFITTPYLPNIRRIGVSAYLLQRSSYTFKDPQADNRIGTANAFATLSVSLLWASFAMIFLLAKPIVSPWVLLPFALYLAAQSLLSQNGPSRLSVLLFLCGPISLVAKQIAPMWFQSLAAFYAMAQGLKYSMFMQRPRSRKDVYSSVARTTRFISNDIGVLYLYRTVYRLMFN